MLSTRAAAFSVDALLNEDTAVTQVKQKLIQSASVPVTVFGSAASKPATVFCSPASKYASVFSSPAQSSPTDASHSKNTAVDEDSSPLGQLTQEDRTKTSYMFTKSDDDDDGWLSIKGKECKIFPFKVGPRAPGLPNATPISKSEPEIDICNLDPNAATTIGLPRVKLHNAKVQVSKTSDGFPEHAIQRNEKNLSGFLPFDTWKNSSTLIEQKVRSSSVDDTLSSSRKMECGHGTRSSLSHPSVLDSTMMSSFEANSVFDTTMSSTTLFKTFQRRTASPKKSRLMDVGAISNIEIGGMRTVPEPTYVGETGFRNQTSEFGSDFTECGHEFAGIERPNFNARKQFPNVGNLNFRTDTIKRPTAGNFTEYEGKEMFMGERGNFHPFSHASSTLYDIRRLEDRRPSEGKALYHRTNSEAQLTKAHAEASPIPVLSIQKSVSFRSQNRFEDDQRRLDRGETAFRNWLASEPMETSSLSPHSRLIQSVLQGDIGQESRDPETTLRPPGCDELRRLLNRNDHIPIPNSFRSEEMEDTELIRLRGGVTVELLQKDLWQKFHQHGTEMIITKIGRRMFPVLRVRIRGLDPSKLYLLYVDMHAVDHKRYRYVYQSSCWLVAGAADTQDQQGREASGGTSPGTGTPSTVPCSSTAGGDTGSGIYLHPDSPASGAHWSAPHTIAFDKLKLTNNRRRPAGGQICLHSMQKYQPRIWIQEVIPDARQPNFASPENSASRNTFPVAPLEYVDADGIVKMDVDEVDKERMKLHYRRRPSNTELRPAFGEDWMAKIDRRLADAAVFPVTSFITVTAYQNQQVTRLKISANPFAKGFRETIKQREDCDSHRPLERHSGVLHEHPLRSFYSHNLRGPFPSYFPHQTHLPPGQMINHLTNYPPFLLPSLPFFVHQWNVTNHRNAGTASPLSSSDDSRINNSINHRKGSSRFEGSTLPWKHSLTSQDEAKKLQQATASTLLRTMSSSYGDNHSSGILEATLKQPASFMQPASRFETRIDVPPMPKNSCHRIKSPKIPIEKCRNDRIADECIAHNTSREEKMGIATMPFTSSQVEIDVTSIPITSSDVDVCSTHSTLKSEINAGSEKFYPDDLWCKSIKPETFRLHGMPTKQTHDLESIASSPPSEVSRRISSSLSHLAKDEPELNYVSSHDGQTSSKNGNLTRQFLLRELSDGNTIVQLSTASLEPSCSEPDDCSVLDLTKKKQNEYT